MAEIHHQVKNRKGENIRVKPSRDELKRRRRQKTSAPRTTISLRTDFFFENLKFILDQFPKDFFN
jgi:hypothetical protein